MREGRFECCSPDDTNTDSDIFDEARHVPLPTILLWYFSWIARLYEGSQTKTPNERMGLAPGHGEMQSLLGDRSGRGMAENPALNEEPILSQDSPYSRPKTTQNTPFITVKALLTGNECHPSHATPHLLERRQIIDKSTA